MKSLIVNNVSKSYKRKSALKDISFEVEKGELFGVIGPDGAGKSTLFRIMTTLILADKGEVKIEGYDVVKDYKKIRNIVGYMPGRFSLYQDLTVRENIEFFAAVFNTTVEENYHLVKDIYSQIEPFEKRKAGALSGGMKQKLALSCALIHKPEVLFLDEPTTGVDPISRKEFWNMLKNLQDKGITIIVSTPYMDEATLCNRIALINEGEFMDINTPQELIRKFPKKLYSVTSSNLTNLMKLLREDLNVESCFSFGHRVHVTLNDETKDEGYEEIEPSIEDYFMRLSKPQN
jgi:ABC-type multidrug transport system ATPase subunit